MHKQNRGEEGEGGSICVVGWSETEVTELNFPWIGAVHGRS